MAYSNYNNLHNNLLIEVEAFEGVLTAKVDTSCFNVTIQ